MTEPARFGGVNAALGVDIGGTFTDVALIVRGRLWTGKQLSTPDDPAVAVIAAISDVLRRSGTSARDVVRIVHATTLATNTILESRGVPVGFVTTQGFRDLLLLGRQARVEKDRYDLHAPVAAVPVSASHCFQVPERVAAGGRVILPLDEAAAVQVASRLGQLGVQAVAICFLHAFAHPDHERRMAEICHTALPAGTVVTCSHEVWPQMREYERATTTLMSAYVGPVMRGYLANLQERLAQTGVVAPIHVMDSSGGIMSAERAAAVAVRTIESGPAAGVVAARQVGLSVGRTDVLAFDMGGTTAKAGVVRGGAPDITREFHVGGRGSFGGRRAGSGIPIKVPAIDLAEVGSGGGSLAWIDAGGALRVGPQSAGARPGPACYGLDGADPTVTDAALLLGYLNPDRFAGGQLRLRPELAAEAYEVLAAGLGVDPVTAAQAVMDIVNAAMGFAVHVVTVARGIDPRRFALVASGGAGPVHAARVADRFGIATVLVPLEPGVGSAIGLLGSELTAERSRALVRPLSLDDAAGRADLAALVAGLDNDACADLGITGGDAAEVRTTWEADVRYRGQAHELSVAFPDRSLSRSSLEIVAQRFTDQYAAVYGSRLDGPLELVGLRVRLQRPPAEADPSQVTTVIRQDSHDFVELPGSRMVFFAEFGGFTSTPVHARNTLATGWSCAGPLVVEEAGATTVVPPHWAITVLDSGVMQLSRAAD